MNNFFHLIMRYGKKIIYNGVRTDHDFETRRRIFLFNSFAYVSILLLLLLGTIAFFEAPLLGIIDLSGALFLLGCLTYLHYSGNERVSSLLAAYFLNIFFCYLFFTGGVKGTAFMWLYTYPVLTFFLLGLYRGTLATILLFLFCLTILAHDLSSSTVNLYSVDFALRFVPSFLSVFFFSFLLEQNRSTAQNALIKKQEALTELVDQLKKKEILLEQAQDRLEHRVALRTAELEKSNQQLREEIETRKLAEQERRSLESKLSQAQKMEALGRMAGGVAHDLNNVLSGIVSYPDLLLLDLPENSPLHAPLQTIKKSGERAAAIVQDLLALARRGIMVREVLSLNDVATDLLQSLEFQRLTRSHPEIRIDTDLDTGLSPISGSMVHLQKALLNLLVNAFEAVDMADEAGSISISTENRVIEAPFQGYENIPPGRYAVLTVSDSGPGIPPEILEKIFEPFYSSKPMGSSGTGLGMTVVWSMVKDHEGFIDISSNPLQGTTITLFFPEAAHDQLSGQQPVVQAEPAHGSGQKILIVDDMRAQRKLAASILEKLGYRVWTVSSGEKAVAFLKDKTVDLVLLDMIMPNGMDGLETYREIIKIVPDQKAVIISGYSKNERVLKGLELGIGAHLKKPYTIAQLSSVIHAQLS